MLQIDGAPSRKWVSSLAMRPAICNPRAGILRPETVDPAGGLVL
jgi:hypothetical protein